MEKTNLIKDFFSKTRNNFNDFYPSEKEVIQKVIDKFDTNINILDLGCATGGLYQALKEKSENISYTGVDIDQNAISFAKQKFKEAKFINSDFNDFLDQEKEKFDIIFSLSCLDWNLNDSSIKGFNEEVTNIFKSVKEGGYLIFSIRLTEFDTLYNSKESYQIIKSTKEKLKASYSIISYEDLNKLIFSIRVTEIIASGFKGKPSKSAITPYEKIDFAVFALKQNKTNFDLKLPIGLKKSIYDSLNKKL
tara:strand:- start:70 stop:816 length:747 start_codon:yes stop_codon:yes gene_type:complete